MGVTQSEIDKFLEFFDSESYDDAVKFLNSNMIICIYVEARLEDDKGYYRCSITVEEAGGVTSSGIYDMHAPITTRFILESKSKTEYLKEVDLAFIMSFISRYFENFKLIFSSSCSYVFVATTDNISAVISECNVLFSKIMALSVFYQDSLLIELNFLKSDAEVSDDMWKIITDSRNNINIIMHHAYISKDYEFSDKIKKRIHDTYESLPDSDKLLLELGLELGEDI